MASAYRLITQAPGSTAKRNRIGHQDQQIIFPTRHSSLTRILPNALDNESTFKEYHTTPLV